MTITWGELGGWSWFRRYRDSSLARNAGCMMAGQGAGYLFQAAYFILLAHLLGSTEYGIYVGAFAFTSLVAQCSSLGTGTVFLRYVSRNPERFAAYWGNILVATLGTSGLLMVVLPVLGRHILNPASARLVMVAANANCLCVQLTLESGRIFRCAEKMHVTAILNLLMNAARFLVVAAMFLALHRATAWQWAVASMIASALVSAIAVTSVLVNFGLPSFQPHLFRKHVWEGLGFPPHLGAHLRSLGRHASPRCPLSPGATPRALAAVRAAFVRAEIIVASWSATAARICASGCSPPGSRKR